ncbi:hypothetical protein DCS_02163 [Drechmeria coniospora]|uniref:LYC1 C-terminal domain-containing protein n=1 Tax=Drechmeria coniospora TaxID=98403 RepID=A0A151GVC9_DRECN|nr:hypothetical protein DCS_02163 [Drechmeria coniospora]KYK61023.1 hypothetical protein DCS_02163 [Drechmeria coniospora]
MLDGDLVFQRATALQITKHLENSSQMWAAPLPKGIYIGLQRQLAEAEASKANAAYWVLFHKDDAETVIASCTTYMRQALINEGHGMMAVQAAVVTDIVTLPEYRMLGMATQLLKKVQQRLDECPTRVEFSIVWSDLRPEFFDRLGWKQQAATQLRIVLGKAAVVEVPAETKELSYSNVDDFALCSRESLNAAKLRLSAMRAKGKTWAQLLPTQNLMRWHAMRGLLTQSALSKGADEGRKRHGASFANAEIRDNVCWAWWVPDFRARKLFVGRIFTTRLHNMQREIKSLLHVAAGEALSMALREVVVWEPTEQVIGAAMQLADEIGKHVRSVVEERSDMIPCLRWHGGEERQGGLVDGQFYGWS